MLVPYSYKNNNFKNIYINTYHYKSRVMSYITNIIKYYTYIPFK